PFEDTVYNVAAAKFMAEKSEGDDVGKTTGMYIASKRSSSDDPNLPPGIRIQASEVKQIRELWEQYGKPKTPPEAAFPIESILKASGLKDFQLSSQTKFRIIKSGIPLPGGKMTF